MSVKIPFVHTSNLNKPDSTFVDLLRNRVCPNFEFASITSVLLGICLLVFIITRIAFTPGGYSQFLQHPQQLDKWALDIELFKSNKAYIYELVTAMFMHFSYRHLIMNVIFGIFVMYEIEYCWRWSIPLALLAGLGANCMAVITTNGIAMGFSGVLCACIGIQFAALILHCSYLLQVYQTHFYMIFLMSVMTLVLVIGFSKSALIHFFGLAFGLLLGLAFYPRMPQASVNPNLSIIFKILGLSFLGLAVVMCLIV